MALVMLLQAPNAGKAANMANRVHGANEVDTVSETPKSGKQASGAPITNAKKTVDQIKGTQTTNVPTTASGLVWTLESNSPGIHQKGLATSQVFRSPAPVPAGSVIMSVRAQRQASRPGYLATTLCTAPAAGRCVVLQGSHVSTRAFNGMPADQVFYLTHTVMGEGPLTPPMFVRASVTVWYSPPGGQ